MADAKMGSGLELCDFYSGKWHCGRDYPTVYLIKLYNWNTGVEAFVWMSNVNVDYDGSPTAYGPDGKGDDNLGNAGKYDTTKGWYGVASYSLAERDEINARLEKQGSQERIKLDTTPGLGVSTTLKGRRLNGKVVEPQIRFPVIQQSINGDPKPGHYVSATSKVARADLEEYQQNRYADASATAFGALSGMLRKKGNVALGDYGLAIRLDQENAALTKTSGFSFQDSGGENDWAVGECSQKVFTDLGGVGHDNNFPVGYVVFPRSKRYDGDVKVGIQDRLRLLTAADNQDDLPLLLAFCAQAGKGRSGYQLWKAYKAKTGLDAVKARRPLRYLNAIDGLQEWGYTGSPRF
jgi:hypothetical protein